VTAGDEAAAFIARNLHLISPQDLPELKLYRAHPASGLRRLTGDDAEPPYWAYGWAGGTVLARFILDHPESVAGKRIADIGTGAGVVAIAAAKSGALRVSAMDIDPLAVVAARLNADANGVAIDVRAGDALSGDPPDADIVLGGDVFYASALAGRATAFFSRCVTAGREVLIGDPGRKTLPLTHLEPLASYAVEDFGHVAGAEPRVSTVYRFKNLL
jgi:predicted nicotinamide N-methyase